MQPPVWENQKHLQAKPFCLSVFSLLYFFSSSVLFDKFIIVMKIVRLVSLHILVFWWLVIKYVIESLVSMIGIDYMWFVLMICKLSEFRSWIEAKRKLVNESQRRTGQITGQPVSQPVFEKEKRSKINCQPVCGSCEIVKSGQPVMSTVPNIQEKCLL